MALPYKMCYINLHIQQKTWQGIPTPRHVLSVPTPAPQRPPRPQARPPRCRRRGSSAPQRRRAAGTRLPDAAGEVPRRSAPRPQARPSRRRRRGPGATAPSCRRHAPPRRRRRGSRRSAPAPAGVLKSGSGGFAAGTDRANSSAHVAIAPAPSHAFASVSEREQQKRAPQKNEPTRDEWVHFFDYHLMP